MWFWGLLGMEASGGAKGEGDRGDYDRALYMHVWE
jgi:hypothetical protein